MRDQLKIWTDHQWTFCSYKTYRKYRKTVQNTLVQKKLLVKCRWNSQKNIHIHSNNSSNNNKTEWEKKGFRENCNEDSFNGAPLQQLCLDVNVTLLTPSLSYENVLALGKMQNRTIFSLTLENLVKIIGFREGISKFLKKKVYPFKQQT